MAIYP